jgi:hypothetical protein
LTGSTSPAIGDLTLAFGGHSYDPIGNAAATQLWNALPTTSPTGNDVRRQTPGGRAYCTMYDGTLSCVLTQFQSVRVSACTPAPANDAAPE